MSGLPGQNLSHWMETLRAAAGLEPPHLSAYSLILEEGTPLASLYAAHKLPPLPSEEEDRAMVHETCEFLASRGLLRYEISNYARPGFESRHNSGYWTGHEYLGLGLGASSCVGGRRFRNTMDLGKYLEILKREECESTDTDSSEAARCLDLLREDVTLLSRQDRMEEFMFLGLRMTRGISEADFCRRFGIPLTEVYGDVLDRQLRTGLLQREGDRYYLTEDGLDVSNTLMAEYLLGDA